MKRSLLMFSAVAAFVVPAVTPMAVLAQDRPEARQDGPRRDRSENRPSRGPEMRRDGGGERRFETRPDRERPSQRPERPSENRPQRPDWNRPDRPTDSARPERPNRPDRPTDSTRPNRPDWGNQQRPGRPDRPTDSTRPDRPNRPDWGNQERPNRPDRPTHSTRPDRPDWNRPDRPNRPEAGRPNRPNWNGNRDYREFHNRWNRDQWRRDWDRRYRNDWWRNDNRFRGWSGVRVGFYFAPGYGYYSVPRSYWNRQWYEGQYLPDVFWRYQVNDWRTYGLGYPPPGTRWVYVDNSIYLIDEYDGYIVEVIRDAWRW